jgi:SAM-dependent methyltransferase
MGSMTDGRSFDPSSYGASIAQEYDSLYEGQFDTDAAVAGIAQMADGGPVLELGIGTGRLAIPLMALGLEVHGVDASVEMIEQLRRKPGGERVPVTIGNFADADAGTRFPLVVLAVNTIYALPDQESQVRCFANAARHLRPDGAFVLEAWVPDLASFRRNRSVRPRIMRGDQISIEVAELDPINQLIHATQAVLRNGDVRVHPTTHRYAWPAELDLMARLAGLRLRSRWADWSGAPFEADSRNHVSVYEPAT